MKFLIRALRGLFNEPVKRRTAFKLGAAAAVTGAAGPLIKVASAPAKLALNKGYRDWVRSLQELVWDVKPGGFAPGGFKLSHELPHMQTKAGRRQLWESSVKPGKSAGRGRFSDGTANPFSKTSNIVRSARSSQAAALRKERALRKLAKEPKILTRRALFSRKK